MLQQISFFSFSHKTINPFIPEVKRTFQTFQIEFDTEKSPPPPFFYQNYKSYMFRRGWKKKERRKYLLMSHGGLLFFQRKLLPDWMEQWQVGERQRSLAPYRKLYRKSRFRFSRTPIAAPLNIRRKGSRTTCCALVTKRGARIRVR